MRDVCESVWCFITHSDQIPSTDHESLMFLVQSIAWYIGSLLGAL